MSSWATLGVSERLFFMTLIVIHCDDFGSFNVENVQSSYSIISFDECVYYYCS
jgi:hypothetical protein